MKFKYPVYMPSLRGNEKKYLNECIDTNWLTETGRFVKSFEEAFSSYVDIRYATVTGNGTLALHLALLALGIGPEDEVIVPTLTYIATANAVAYTGAKPVFADCEPDTWQLSPGDVRKRITSKTKAIIPVHLYGHPCDMHEIMKIADEHDLFVVEDAAEAFGATLDGQHVGTFGDIGIFSFFGNKTITTGEGGMLITNDKTLFDRAHHYKGQGLAKWREYWHDVVGYNYRMTNLSAAIGLAQIENAASILRDKKNIADWYKEFLAEAPVTFQAVRPNVVHSYWMVTILADNSETRDDLREYLKENGIETRPTFYPIHTMPMYSMKYQMHRNAEDIGWRGINLPSYPDLTKEDVAFIAQTIIDFYKKSG